MKIQNYRLVEKREVPEAKATGYLFEHEKSGAQVFYLSAPEDDNKVFSIAFTTPPENSRGIPHILEHCVLNGSRKFPVKEPFVELLKGSLNTFLNAMTFADKTVYPVASRNEQDFMNLMDVYLDAVFYPNVKKNELLFRQEGWHYELDTPESELKYKGVVYNEMRGAYSSGDTVLEELSSRALFPESLYGLDSGGDPDVIPELTYEEFCAFHDTYYHACNSLIYFYGNGDIEKHLRFLDTEYLSNFDRPEGNRRLPAVIARQPYFTEPKEVEGCYSISEGESLEGKTYLSLAVLLKGDRSNTRLKAVQMLCTLLTGTEASPLKMALLKAGIGTDVSCYADRASLQPSLRIIVQGADERQKDDFVRVTRETLQEIVKNGFSKELKEALLNMAEFSAREADYGRAPKGLMLGITCLGSWLYGDGPFPYLYYEDAFREMREDLFMFERIVDEEILQNPHTVLSVLKPQPGLSSQKDAELARKLAEQKSRFTEEEIAHLVAETARLKKAQQTPDSPEDLEKLPLLKLSDMEPVHRAGEAQRVMRGSVPCGIYETETSGIAYMSLCFSMDHVPESHLPYVSLLSKMLTAVDTKKQSYADLTTSIGLHLGGLTVYCRVLSKKDGSFAPYFCLSSKFLNQESEEAFRLSREVLLESVLTDKARLKELVAQERTQLQDVIGWAGNTFAKNRADSYHLPIAAYNEKLSGIDMFLFLKDLEQHFEEKADEAVRHLQETVDILLRQENLRVRLTLESARKEPMLSLVSSFAESLPKGPSPLASLEVVRARPEKKNEAFITPGLVQYVARSGSFGKPFTGSMMVMKQILDLEYLWNKVRAQGGAYGCRSSISRSGSMNIASYRDPNLSETAKIYREAGSFLSSFEASERELTKYIIGTVGELDPVLSVSGRGEAALDYLETGYSDEDLQKTADEAIATSLETIREIASSVQEAMDSPYLCVIGSEAKIEEQKELFDRVIRLF